MSFVDKYIRFVLLPTSLALGILFPALLASVAGLWWHFRLSPLFAAIFLVLLLALPLNRWPGHDWRWVKRQPFFIYNVIMFCLASAGFAYGFATV